MTIIEVKKTKDVNKIYLNSDFCESADLFEEDLISIHNEDTGTNIFGRISILDSIDLEYIALGENISDNLGVFEGEIVEISKYDGEINIASKLSIEFDAKDYDIDKIQNDENFKFELVSFLRQYYLQDYSRFYWPEENAELTIYVKDDIDFEKPTKLTDFNDEFSLTIKPSATSTPFNAIIVLDCSASMGKYDISFSDMKGSIDNLINIYQGSTSQHKELLEYLEDLEPKFVQDKTKIKIRRLDATFLSMLMFFNQKISRGKGEKCSVIFYSGRSKIFSFENKKIFSTSDMTNIKIINKIRKTMFSSSELNTNKTIFSFAIDSMKQNLDLFSKDSDNPNPLMVLLLTDGKPEPKTLDPPSKIIAKIQSLKRYIKQLQNNFIIFTMGIGNESNIDTSLLKEIAKEGNGKYKFSENFKELTTYFEELANEFAIVLKNN